MRFRINFLMRLHLEEMSICYGYRVIKLVPNRDERVIQNNEEPKENKVVRRTFL